MFLFENFYFLFILNPILFKNKKSLTDLKFLLLLLLFLSFIYFSHVMRVRDYLFHHRNERKIDFYSEL